MTLDSDLRDSIESLLTENPVVLFMKGNRQTPQCGFSAKTVSALDLLVPDYVTIDVLQYPDIREGIKAYGDWPTIPQLYVKGELIGGSDIVLEMMQSGELADALDITVPESALPQLHIADAAAEIMRNAIESQPTMTLHLQINAGWEHEFSLAPEGQGIAVESNGITICLDPWSAERANGLRIELEENLAGTAFNFDNPNAPPPVNQVTVQQLKEKLDVDKTVHLFDVRSAEEQAKAVIEGARPWNREALEFIQSLPKDVELIFHCHMGGRSQAAAEQCRRMGYTNLHNLKGGIKAWSIEIDSSVPDY
jgi:monothiol glutaredoxin